MTAALTWVVIMVMGGSSLLYVSGDERERRAVRSQRLLIAIPIMIAATAGITGLYQVRGYASPALVAAGGIMMLNSLAELRYSDLVRQMRFVAASAVLTVPRLLALALLIGGAPLTAALAIGAAVYLLSGEVVVCRTVTGARPMWTQLSFRNAARAFRLNRRLFSYSLADAFSARAGTIALSLVASPHVVGCYGALVSIYQALVAVVFSGLRVPMAVRTRRRHRIGPPGSIGREAELISVLSASVIAFGIVTFASRLTMDILDLGVPDAALWLQLLALALPFATINRAFAMNRIGDGDYGAATQVATAVAMLVGVGLLIQATTLGAAGVATSAAGAELVVAVAILVVAGRRRWARRPTTGATNLSVTRRRERASQRGSVPVR
ncbi:MULTISPECIES: hypothetical protein [unclassified Micromonospora]|uniref:hypothetical protein n=1 Tax=unclassified Micromonospora TaxID=2617518 RepID=UPI0022B6C155|nr:MULTISPECIES: hypothetical protein [unclassified Micromonospora]MCZ7419885.1 hypothetical protein [Verrucosispora sp. WMMA2121]WBB89568.1 hypothetical protein O7597_21530 [Verrucosispora sp. WMMC514]